jgi:hypothetical protein
MQTKFCIEVINGNLKVEIQGSSIELRALLATVLSEEPKIKSIVLDAMVAVICKRMEEDSDDSIKDMLESLNIQLN